MTYFPDRAPCTYFGPELADRLVAACCLDGEQAYSRSEASESIARAHGLRRASRARRAQAVLQ